LEAGPGEIYIPRVPSARMTDIANVLIDGRPIKVEVTGIRPGEKVHEILVSEEEGPRTLERGNYYVILAILPELRHAKPRQEYLNREYSSAEDLMTSVQVRELLETHRLLVPDEPLQEAELLR